MCSVSILPAAKCSLSTASFAILSPVTASPANLAVSTAPSAIAAATTASSAICSLPIASSAILAAVIASAAISAVTTPPVLIVTTPLDTSKLSLEKEAIPFALVEAKILLSVKSTARVCALLFELLLAADFDIPLPAVKSSNVGK